MKILLDAGHGEGPGHNRGSLIGNEGDNNYLYSLVLKRVLEEYEGVEVKLTRPNSSDNPELDDRGRMGDGFDLLLSLHSNAFGKNSVNGIEIFDSVRRPCKVLATALVDNLSELFRNNRGVKYRYYPSAGKVDYYGVLRAGTAKCAFIIEHGFHTNREDALVYTEQREELARITARTIAAHYGLVHNKEHEPKPSIPVPKPEAPAPKPVAQGVKVGDSIFTNATKDKNGTNLSSSRINPKVKFTVAQVSGKNVLLKEVSTWVGLDTIVGNTAPTVSKNKPSGNWTAEKGTFTPNTAIFERNNPTVKDKTGMSSVQAGTRYAYDAYYIDGGYVWLRNANTGKVIPWRVHRGEKWGTIV